MFRFETDAETSVELYDDLIAAWSAEQDKTKVKPGQKAPKVEKGGSARSMANEARHQARKAAEESVDTDAAERLGWPHIVIEVLEFVEPLTFVYHELVPSTSGEVEIPLSDHGFWSAKDKGSYDRHISPMLDIDRHVERRNTLADNGFRWVAWQDLPARLRYWIISRLLPGSWTYVPDPSGGILELEKLDRVMVFVKGQMPA